MAAIPALFADLFRQYEVKRTGARVEA